MTTDEIINIIKEHSLTVRCLPYTVVKYRTYRDGDENKKYVDSNGNSINNKREVIVQNYNLEYFQKTKSSKYNNPNGRKMLKETRTVDKGGWWYVKPTKNIDSTVRFDRKYDEFFAPTLEEAIELFLNSIKD